MCLQTALLERKGSLLRVFLAATTIYDCGRGP